MRTGVRTAVKNVRTVRTGESERGGRGVLFFSEESSRSSHVLQQSSLRSSPVLTVLTARKKDPPFFSPRPPRPHVFHDGPHSAPHGPHGLPKVPPWHPRYPRFRPAQGLTRTEPPRLPPPRAGAHSHRVTWTPPRVTPAEGTRQPPPSTFNNSGGCGLHWDPDRLSCRWGRGVGDPELLKAPGGVFACPRQVSTGKKNATLKFGQFRKRAGALSLGQRRQ